jgi:hypothetical protein
LKADSQAVNTRPAGVVGTVGWADAKMTEPQRIRAITRIGI